MLTVDLLGVRVKGVWGIPRPTHRVFASWLSEIIHHSSFKEDLLARWVPLYQSFLASLFTELAVIVRVTAEDLRNTTGANNWLIYTASGLVARTATSAKVRSNLRRKEEVMTNMELALVNIYQLYYSVTKPLLGRTVELC